MKKHMLIVFLCLGSINVLAQSDTSTLYKILMAKDSVLFNVGYNTCDIATFGTLLSENFEFYHDEAGITSSKPEFIKNVQEGLCKLPYKATRQLVVNSMAVYPLRKKGVLYGAIQTGEHRFYAREPGKSEYLTSTAKFTSVWLLEAGDWKLSRVLSYNHQ